MLALSSQLCSSSGWLWEDHIQQQQNTNFFCGESTQTSEHSINDLHSPNCSRAKISESAYFNDGFNQLVDDDDHDHGDDKIAKKLNHNASERDRRKKINALYSTLRSLLPAQDQSKKLSIPNTVSKVLKYIPELQKEIERLIQKKESLLSKTNCGLQHSNHSKTNSMLALSATPIGNGEILIQSSIPKAENASFSEAILNLEEEGFLLINASCFQSFGGRLFYNLHLKAQGSEVMDAQVLKEKALSLYKRGEQTIP